MKMFSKEFRDEARRIPKFIHLAGLMGLVLALLPVAVALRAREVRTDQPPLHGFFDMDDQPKFKAQRVNPLFADHRSARLPVTGTVARGELRDNAAFFTGQLDGKWDETIPLEVTEAVMNRGQERFNIYCAPCHGQDGAGNGMVNVRAMLLMNQGKANWVEPANLADVDRVRRSDGQLFGAITYGIRNMPSYASQISAEDRWAIVAYVRALQRAHNSLVGDVPPGVAVAEAPAVPATGGAK